MAPTRRLRSKTELKALGFSNLLKSLCWRRAQPLGVIATPYGVDPTAIVPTTLLVAVSIIEMVLPTLAT
jgi:hypothetical protein